jgi:hypothetical protein
MHLIGLLTLQHLTGNKKTGGGERDRTDGLLRARQALSQLSYTPGSGDRCQVTGARCRKKPADRVATRPTAFRGVATHPMVRNLIPVSWNQDPDVVGLGGLEPPTSRLSGVRSNQLSYRPPLTPCFRLYTSSPLITASSAYRRTPAGPFFALLV